MRGRIFATVVFFAIAVCCIVKGDPCPPKEDVEPCVCNPFKLPVNVTCSNITNMDDLYAVFDKSVDFPFYEFQLQDCSLMYLPASAVKRKRMERIAIVDCIMASIFESRPDPTNSVTVLRLLNTSFQRGINWEFFSSFSQLAFLEFEGVEVKRIGKMFKDNINNEISVISIIDGKTSVLEDGVFATLQQLEKLVIRNSLIKTVKRSMFPDNCSLVYFDFSGNSIQTLPDDMFVNMPHLKSINLERNQLTVLPDDMFVNMPYLKSINLEGNQLTVLPEAIYGDIYKRQGSELSFEGNPVVCDCPLRWIFPKSPARVVKGVCAEPPSKNGMNFDMLTPDDFNYC